MSILRVLATLSTAEVERATPEGPPIAFRIWSAGPNVTDHGTHIFSTKSAQLILADQAARKNLFSFDIDHLSLNDQAPPDSHQAVGWHQLEVRQAEAGPELWAVNVQWSAEIAAGLTANPPRWRYFSPAYGVEKATGEIVSYINCAVTNNPATHEVTALATSVTKGTAMDIKAIVAALFGDDDEKKKEARAAVASMNDQEKKAFRAACKAAFDDGAEEPAEKTPEKKPEDDCRSTEDPAEKKPEEEAAVKAAIDLAGQNLALAKRLQALEDDKLTAERETILASRKDLPAKLVETLRAMPIALMKATMASIDPPKTDPSAAQKVTGTIGGNTMADGTQMVRAARLPPGQHEALRERFGHEPEPKAPFWERSDKVYPTLRPEAARKILAARNIPMPSVGGRPSPDLINAVRQASLQVANGGSK